MLGRFSGSDGWQVLGRCEIDVPKASVDRKGDAVEWETLKWVDWFNNRRLLEPIGYITPTEAEEAYYANVNALDKVA